MPFSLQSLNILEKCFINQKTIENTKYRYDLNSSEIEFCYNSRINSKDSLTVWMMIYSDAIDLKKLLFTKNIDLRILAMRACFQKDFDLLDLIIKKATPIKKQNSKNKFSTIRFLFFKKQNLKPKKSSNYVISILKYIENNPNILKSTVNSKLDVKILKQSKFKYSTSFELNSQTYDLMKPKDIFLCLTKDLNFESVSFNCK